MDRDGEPPVSGGARAVPGLVADARRADAPASALEVLPMTRDLLFAVLLLPCAGCVVQAHEPRLNPLPFEIATVEKADGARDRFVIGGGAAGPRLLVESSYRRVRPFLGLRLAELDEAGAARRGVRPYTGLLVTGVYPGSAAEDAGILSGDVIRRVDGEDVSYVDRMSVLESRMRIGAKAEIAVLRGQEVVTRSLDVRSLEEDVNASESIPLERTSAARWAGADLFEIPDVWCRRIYGEPRVAIVLGDIEIGGPAWLAGIRAGDIVDGVDGLPTPRSLELARLLAERARGGGSVELAVGRGPGDRHRAVLHPRERAGGKEIWFPFLFHVEDGSYEDRWTIGPLGLLAANRNRYVGDQTTREVATRNAFSALVHLIRVETGPDETCLRLLWFFEIRL